MARLYSEDGWTYKEIKHPTAKEQELIEEQERWKRVKRDEKELEPTIVAQESLISSIKERQIRLQKKQAILQGELEGAYLEEQQAKKVLEELYIKEELSKLSKEQLLEQAYLRETKGIELNSLSQEELTALMKVLTKLRGSK
jgi:hypothetical protein